MWCPPAIDVVICEDGPLCPFITTLVPSGLVNVNGSPLVGAGVAIETVIRACRFFPTETLLMVKVPEKSADDIQAATASMRSAARGFRNQ